MGDHAFALAAAFRHCGQPAEVLPLGDDETLRWGRKFTTGKECLPCIITTGDMLKKVNKPDCEPDRTAFFMPASSGPCRFGQYNCLQRLILKQFGVPNNVPVIAPNQDSNFYETFKQIGKDPTYLAALGIAAVDLLQKVLLMTRPYENETGRTDQTYQNCLDRMVAAIDAGCSEKDMIRVLESCAADMAAVPIDRNRAKPLITVVGEIYVRSHHFANGNIVRQLEALGGEVSLAGFDEWLYYTNFTRKKMALRWGNYRLYLQNLIKNFFQHRMERRLARPLERVFGPLAEGPVEELLEAASGYIHESFEGEAILTLGKISEMYHHGAAGAVNVMPFTCMPSTIVSAISRQLSIDADGMPILNISYDGQQDPTLQTRLEAFMYQVRAFNRRAQATPVRAH